jgi:hypothetical protein
MKKYSFLIIIWAVAFTSCKKENFLDLYPKDALSEPTYFKNENDLKLYANRFYGLLPAPLNGTGDDNSDNTVPATRNTFLAGTYVVPVTGGGWTWTDVRATNYFLQRYQKAEVTQDVKNRYAAEVRLFRAYLYWQRVKQFGDVPYYNSDFTDTSTALLYAPKTSRKVVMDSVLADLDFAVANLPAPASIPAADRGRLHNFAAQALKARICLWEGTFRRYHNLGDDLKYLRAAADAAEAVINSGLYDVYKPGSVNTNYYNLFIQEDLSTNKEAILFKSYQKDILMHNTTRTIGQNNSGFSKNFVRSYLVRDGLPTSLSPLYRGDDSLDAEVANRDPRFPQTIATRGFTFLVNPDGSRDTISLPRIGTAATNTGYQLAKYRSSDYAQFNANQSTIDMFIFRYAEVLLVFAEAKAELGEASQAVIDRSIKLLRDRVGMPNLIVAGLRKDPASDFPAVPALIDEIRRERRIELALEGLRFDDLLRWKAGKQIENPETILGMKLHPNVRAQYPAAQVRNIVVDANNYIRIYTNLTARSWNDRMYYYPLPTQELTLNKNLTQNTGW